MAKKEPLYPHVPKGKEAQFETVKHQVTLTDEELKALADRLVPISPTAYDLHTYAILRNLYGRFQRLLEK